MTRRRNLNRKASERIRQPLIDLQWPEENFTKPYLTAMILDLDPAFAILCKSMNFGKLAFGDALSPFVAVCVGLYGHLAVEPMFYMTTSDNNLGMVVLARRIQLFLVVWLIERIEGRRAA